MGRLPLALHRAVNACRRPLLAVAIAASAVSCGDSEAKWRARLDRRAKALALLPLPIARYPGPPGVFVNTLVPTALIETKPTGATVRIDGKDRGVAPIEVPTADLVVDAQQEAGASCRISFARNGEAAPIRAYRLRFEAAEINAGLDVMQVPQALRARDHYFYFDLTDSESTQSQPK
ncbi:MAG: hypothetical protein JNJ88_09455 [Planctomycetes bacterium]|nr:hypothetical protein [Planctomycetota bacterium]